MSSFVRLATTTARISSRSRLFSTSTVVRKDFIQDLYVKELKGYKAPPQAQDAHVGVVKDFVAPATPKAPALPADLASELAAYDAAEPVSDAVVNTTTSEDGPTGADAFLSFLEADPPKAADAHH